jgi:hypothetical protein
LRGVPGRLGAFELGFEMSIDNQRETAARRYVGPLDIPRLLIVADPRVLAFSF